jgi:hypothetical protein
MKKIILTTTFITLSLLVFCQNFAGNDVELYRNKEIKVKPVEENLQKYGYHGFYTDKYLNDIFENGSGSDGSKFATKYSILANKTFKVLSYESYTNSIGKQMYRLIIENKEIGVLFYDYNPQYDLIFPFEVIGGLTLPSDFYCKYITKTFDKFTGETKYKTDSGGIFFLKVVKDGSSKVYLSINQPGATPTTISKKGLIILLDNNHKIEKTNAEIESKENGSGGYYNSTFVELSNDDINLLKTYNMTDLRLYINDGVVENPEKYKELIKCLDSYK